MTLTEKFIADTIQLDSGAEIMYGSDQIYDIYPCRFPTVEFQLTATDALVEVAERIRMEKGYIPMHPRDSRTDDVDNDGWYEILNRQCRSYHGKDCAALLAEAEAEMSDD